jgi:hypothetical protein
MAGSLIKIDEEIVTSAVASVTLTGIDSTYDVYMVKLNNVVPVTDIQFLYFRVTVSGTPDTTANYDRAGKFLRTNSAFANPSGTNETQSWIEGTQIGNQTGEQLNSILYLFNFPNASEYSFLTRENTTLSYLPALSGSQGGTVHTVAQACDGIQFYFGSGNIDTGSKFTLYGLKK